VVLFLWFGVFREAEEDKALAEFTDRLKRGYSEHPAGELLSLLLFCCFECVVLVLCSNRPTAGHS
jgi:hypothetical protein